MRHGKKFRSLSRQKGHRKALLGNLASELVKHKRIKTTLAKGKELRKYVEPILTKAKTDTTHSRREVFKALLNNEQAKGLVNELFREIGPKIADRPGGYTRIIKTGNRLGDNAEMCIIELVDYNELLLGGGAEKKKTRRSRRGSSNAKTTTETKETESTVEDAVVVEEAPKKEIKEKAKSDDLKKIEGIGPKIAETLVSGGITSYADLAKSSPEEVKAILDAAEGNFNRHDPATWPDQAKLAADGKWDELKKWQDELDGGKPAEDKE